MARYARFFTVAALVLLSAAGPVRAEDLSIEAYFDVTLARLELAATRWEQTRSGPTEEEMEALFAQHGTTTEAYHAYAGEHRQEVEGYLEANPEAREAVDALSARIQTAIDQASTEPTEEQ